MKLSKIILLVLLSLCMTLAFCSCFGGEDPTEPTGGNNPPAVEEDTTYTVNVIASDSAAVEFPFGKSVTVKEGESATIRIKVKSGYIFDSVTSGTYDTETGVLTVTGVTNNVRVTFKTTALGYNPDEQVYFTAHIASGDYASVTNGQKVNYGQKVTLIANDESRYFKGWTVGGPYYSPNAREISSERDIEITVLPELLGASGGLVIYANYAEDNIVKYNANGGSVNVESDNMKLANAKNGNKYYTTSHNSGVVTVTLSEDYMKYAECASTFWDDGTFYREGYVLVEYNTKADGTGESYSLGSKCYAPSLENQTLYCIWKEAETEFVVEDISIPYDCGASVATAPHWKTEGVKITKYNGNSKTVTIPEMIGGKYVTAIGTDAFVDKDIDTLVISRFILKIEDGAFKNCPNLNTVYMSDGIYEMTDAAFDSNTLKGIKKFYLNATMAPRFARGDGAFAVKLSRILASEDKKRIIVVSGSSTYQGLGTEYMEALFGGEYRVVNMGTTRTGTGMIFFEAMQHYTHEGDIVVYAPENHVNMFGENTMWYRSYYDTEGMYNLFRYIDISHYPNAFTALSAYNRERRFSKTETAYEDIITYSSTIDKYGDYHNANRKYFRDDPKNPRNYIDSYFITMNQYYKNDLKWDDVEYQTANKDYIANTNGTWTDFTIYKDEVNRAIRLIKATGATVCFGFAPVDGDDVVPEAQNAAWLDAYDALIRDNYEFDALLGSCKDYIFAHTYFYDCAYHVNDYGRTYRTYQLYLDVCELVGKENVRDIDAVGTDFKGCLFESDSDGTPVTKVSYLNN